MKPYRGRTRRPLLTPGHHLAEVVSIGLKRIGSSGELVLNKKQIPYISIMFKTEEGKIIADYLSSDSWIWTLFYAAFGVEYIKDHPIDTSFFLNKKVGITVENNYEIVHGVNKFKGVVVTSEFHKVIA